MDENEFSLCRARNDDASWLNCLEEKKILDRKQVFSSHFHFVCVLEVRVPIYVCFNAVNKWLH